MGFVAAGGEISRSACVKDLEIGKLQDASRKIYQKGGLEGRATLATMRLERYFEAGENANAV
jgi:hypothetical protein